MSMRNIKIEVSNDVKVHSNVLANSFQLGGVSNDLEHAQHRSSKRAIPLQYIQLAITYGTKKRAVKALSFTIYDKDLIRTPYYKYISTLRGVCVIVDYNNTIITTYWLFKAKKNG